MLGRIPSRPFHSLSVIVAMFGFVTSAHAQATRPTSFEFAMGTDKTDPGHTQVLPDMTYTPERGFGFEPGAAVKAGAGSITSDKPFLFSVAVPEGNYRVTVTLGDRAVESKTTVKAEIRRLMVENAHLPAGKMETHTFTVNVRTPAIPGGGVVRLKDREKTSESRAWDDKLTLEFDDARPCVGAIEISKIDKIPVVYICGDSTVCDQPGESFASWGQMLTRFVKPDVVLANHAESGESLKSFIGEKRWDKVMSLLQPGDYVLIQMGHNDEKEKGTGVGAFTTYKADLKRLVADARKKGAMPVVITPMERRGFAGNKVTPSHGDYPEAVRQVAKEDNVPLIDLTAMSIKFYEALGPDKAYLAFAGNGPNRDPTHHDNYGAYELAKCIAIGLRETKLDLAKSIVDDLQNFDPAKPDDVDSFTMPAGPSRVTATPLGS